VRDRNRRTGAVGAGDVAVVGAPAAAVDLRERQDVSAGDRAVVEHGRELHIDLEAAQNVVGENANVASRRDVNRRDTADGRVPGCSRSMCVDASQQVSSPTDGHPGAISLLFAPAFS